MKTKLFNLAVIFCICASLKLESKTRVSLQNAFDKKYIKAKAICTLTNSGYTAFQISSWRPSAHILVFTSNKRILTQLNLLWGVKSFYYAKSVSTDDTVTDVNEIARQKGFVEKGDFLINLAAMPITDKGMVNTLRVSEIE